MGLCWHSSTGMMVYKLGEDELHRPPMVALKDMFLVVMSYSSFIRIFTGSILNIFHGLSIGFFY